jgi:hypothetical protein
LFAYHRTWANVGPFRNYYFTAKKHPRIGHNIYVISSDKPKKPKYYLEGLYVVSGIGRQRGKKRELLLKPLMRCVTPLCISTQSWFDSVEFRNRFAFGGGMTTFPVVYEERFYKLLSENNPIFDNTSFEDSIDDIGSDHAQRGIAVRSFVLRDPTIRRAVKERANGKCEYCGELGFKCEDGTPYLEAHHIIALAGDGKDRMSNVIAVCADDHRQAHFAANREEIERKMHEIVTRLCQNSVAGCNAIAEGMRSATSSTGLR